MRRYRRSNTFTARGVYLRKRIAHTQSRAKFVGTLYLLATIALAVAACFSLFAKEFAQELAPIGVLEFWKQFKPANFKGLNISHTDKLIAIINSALYALMLLGVVVSVFKSLSRLGWLNKKRANKTDGFNRNVYAMEDMGRIFAGALALILSTYFVIAILCGGKVQVNWIMYAVVGGGVFIHLVCGVLGAKIAYYDIENGDIIEERRAVGRFAPFFRNVLQIAAVGAIMFFFLKWNDINVILHKFTSLDNIKAYFKEVSNIVSVAVQVVIILCVFVLVKHAVNVTEYNFDGAQGSGMANYKVFTFFVFLVAAAGVVYTKFLTKGEQVWDMKLIYIAAIALAMFIIEVIMHAMPKYPDAGRKIQKLSTQEEEFSFDAIIRAQQVAQQQAQQMGMQQMGMNQMGMGMQQMQPRMHY